MLKNWQKKVVITGKPAVLLGTIMMEAIGIFLLYCAINPPECFDFLKENINRLIYGIFGVLLVWKGIKNAFYKHNR